MKLMSFIRSHDAAIYYEEYGSGDPLILLPGLLGTIETDWRRFIPEFASHFHTIAADLRGHGRTNNPAGILRIQTLVNDLHELLETLEIEQSCICGFDFGGYIGLVYGIQHPEKIIRLVMHGATFSWTPELVRRRIAELNLDVIIASNPEWAESLRQSHSYAEGPDGWRKLLGSAREFMSLIPSHVLPESALSAARFPVLVSRGEFDTMVLQEETERLVATLPNAELRIMEKAAHEMHTVQKTQFLFHALAFLKPKEF